MGFQNILTASYQGRLGNTYGVKQAGQAVVKAIPFSHAPHSPTQKKQFNAFGKLQRFSAPLAKKYWGLLGLSDKSQQRINAVAHYFKKMQSNKEFSPTKINDVLPENADFTFIDSFFAIAESVIYITYQNVFAADASQQPQIILTLLDENGKNYGTTKTWQIQETIVMPIALSVRTDIHAIALISVLKNGKRELISANYNLIPIRYYRNKIFYPELLYNGQWHYEEPKTLVGENIECEYAEKTLTLVAN